MRMFMTWMIPDILINVEAHIMGHAATFMRMREEAELDWLSVSLLRRMVLVRSQVLSLFTPHININDMLMTWMMPNMLAWMIMRDIHVWCRLCMSLLHSCRMNVSRSWMSAHVTHIMGMSMSITPYINETRMRLHECCDNHAMNITAHSCALIHEREAWM